MSRLEFLQRLRDTLMGEVPGNVVEENIRYYDEYIRTEAAKGLTEEEVTNSIGDPRLIAKTIMEATENARGSGYQSAYDSYQETGRNAYGEGGGKDSHFHNVDLNKWYWKLLAVAVVILFFIVVFGIISGLLSLFIPLMGPIMMVLLIFWMIRRPRR